MLHTHVHTDTGKHVGPPRYRYTHIQVLTHTLPYNPCRHTQRIRVKKQANTHSAVCFRANRREGRRRSTSPSYWPTGRRCTSWTSWLRTGRCALTSVDTSGVVAVCVSVLTCARVGFCPQLRRGRADVIGEHGAALQLSAQQGRLCEAAAEGQGQHTHE